jgi:hypothetical protein
VTIGTEMAAISSGMFRPTVKSAKRLTCSGACRCVSPYPPQMARIIKKNQTQPSMGNASLSASDSDAALETDAIEPLDEP